jgi:hypothetical protein
MVNFSPYYLTRVLQCHCYDFVYENVGNPALNTRPTILNLFLCIFTILEMVLTKAGSQTFIVKISGYESNAII